VAENFVEGVFEEEKVLTGGLRESIKYWVKMDGEAYVLEYLRLDGASTGMEAERLSEADFQKRFSKTEEKEPEEEKTPEEEERDKLVRLGEIHMEKNEFHSAEYEFKNALKVDESSVKASLGLGQSFVGQGKIEEAKEVFSALGENEELYKEENKHTFNELGISLRKQEMYDEAVKNYHRAIQLDTDDPVLHYNLSLALYHSGQMATAKKFLSSAIEMDGKFEDAKKLLKLIESKV
jgi:Tfp pilus assembly protein PilF